MIKHIVMFNIKPEYEAKKTDVAEKLKHALEKLPETIEVIREYEVGINEAKSDSAWDIVLISAFHNETDLNEYRHHPDHKNVVELINHFTSQRAVVDYETPGNTQSP